MIKISTIINSLNISPFLLGLFFSKTNFDDKNKIIEIYTCFKKSKYATLEWENIDLYCNDLINKYNFLSGINDWQITRKTNDTVKIALFFENDNDISKDKLYSYLHNYLINSYWIKDIDINEDKKNFIRAFVESRGSIDTTIHYISEDYFWDNIIDQKKAYILIDLMSIPEYYMNYNSRELQPDYFEKNILRNPQLRINLEYYISEIGIINEYKAIIIKNRYKWNYFLKDRMFYFNVDIPKIKKFKSNFSNMLQFFSNFVYKKELDTELIEKLRKEIGFDKNKYKIYRSQSIKKYIDENTPDICAVCKTDKTFERAKNNKQYFEIHHVISFYNNIYVLDNPGNLVKLCPNCHTKFKKGRSTAQEQIDSILTILNDYIQVYEFACAFLNISDKDELAKKIQEMLG